MRGSAINITVWIVCLVPGPAQAQALDWDRLWLNDDQRAAGKMARADYTEAARAFDDERWRAAAWYRAGDYERAAGAWAKMDDTEAHYNRGNALARSGRLEAAMNAYETVLERDPGHADARYNLEVIRERMQQSGESGSDRQAQQDSSKREHREDQHGARRSRPGGQDSGRRSNDSSSEPWSQGNGSRPEERDSRKRQAANRAQEETVGRQEATPGPEAQQDRAANSERTLSETGTREERAAMEQWLRRVPDDPGGLLRRKFLYQYRARQRGDEEVAEPW